MVEKLPSLAGSRLGGSIEQLVLVLEKLILCWMEYVLGLVFNNDENTVRKHPFY